VSTAATGLVPGDGIAVVSARVLVLLDGSAADVVADVAAGLDEGGGVDAVLEVLAAAGLRNLGSFAVVAEEDAAVRVVVRGDAVVRIGASETVEIGGAGLRTWNEHVVDGWTTLALGLGTVPEAPSLFNVDRGVVPASGLVRPNVADATGPIVDAPAPSTAMSAQRSLASEPTAPDAMPTLLSPPPGPEPVPPVRTRGAPDDVDPEVAEPEVVDPEVAEPEVVEPPIDAPMPDEPVFEAAHTLLPGALPAPAEPSEPLMPSEYNSPYDELYGHTVHRRVQDAAMHVADDVADGAPPAAAELGDHDGHTVSLAELRRLQQAETAGSDAAGQAALGDHDGHTMTVDQLSDLQGAAPATVSGVMVQALVCPAGHPNATHEPACSRCGAALAGPPVAVARPVLGHLVLSTGESIELDKPVVIGRNPRIEGRLSGELPKVVRLDTHQGLSRTHAMVRIEGWQVLIVDLGSANHTTVTLPGRPPRRLHADEPMLLTDGASIDFGGEVTATYDASL